MTNPASLRQESGFLGTGSIPAEACRGVPAARAVETFPVSGQPLSCMLEPVCSAALVKKAANERLGVPDAQRTSLIAEACDELIAGQVRRTANGS